MLKATGSTRKPKPPTRAKGKKPAGVPAKNLRAIAFLEELKQRPTTEEEIAIWDEALKSLDESRPHRPLFS